MRTGIAREGPVGHGFRLRATSGTFGPTRSLCLSAFCFPSVQPSDCSRQAGGVFQRPCCCSPGFSQSAEQSSGTSGFLSMKSSARAFRVMTRDKRRYGALRDALHTVSSREWLQGPRWAVMTASKSILSTSSPGWLNCSSRSGSSRRRNSRNPRSSVGMAVPVRNSSHRKSVPSC
jgi:hypothetical protein